MWACASICMVTSSFDVIFEILPLTPLRGRMWEKFEIINWGTSETHFFRDFREVRQKGRGRQQATLRHWLTQLESCNKLSHDYPINFANKIKRLLDNLVISNSLCAIFNCARRILNWVVQDVLKVLYIMPCFLQSLKFNKILLFSKTSIRNVLLSLVSL